ncbi:MAG: hypothetical protein NT024_14525, partial [Proteobacteria bacterium]|nr:hypothetical protein [Pseudomonadota bacterium]
MISDNTAYGAQGVYTYGGGIYLKASGMRLVNCEEVANTVKMYGDPFAYGGGAYMEYGSLAISNTVMRGNTAGAGGRCMPPAA